MPYYVITYDVRARNHDYTGLNGCMAQWKAAHLQNSVWLADLVGPASTIRDILKFHMHPDDTVCVIQIFQNSDWATSWARTTGTNWLLPRCKA